MKNENELLPYEAAEIPAERALVFAAHPDDEVLGAGGLLAAWSKSAEAVRVVVLTDGRAQEQRSHGSADAETRRREALEAGAVLGLTDYLFESFPDRSLAGQKPALTKKIRSLISEFRPDVVLAPWPGEVHPDHRAVGEAVFEIASASRPGDADRERLERVRLVFYEISLPLLPNALVPLAERAAQKAEAAAKFRSQAVVRDYAGSIVGLNTYRSLTLSESGPAEAFRVLSALEASTRSLEEFRRSIGPTVFGSGAGAKASVGVVIRTKNRPALLAEALESVACQRVLPAEVVVVNDGGGSISEIIAKFEKSLPLSVVEHAASKGRSAAANAGAERVRSETIAFLDDDDVFHPDHIERLSAARSAGPEPIVYGDSVAVVMARRGEEWKERHRELQYSLDFDPEYLLFANYIPLPAILIDASLFRKVGGFDASLDFSEDWDLLIRLSRESPFRHVRGVTSAYRIFEGESGHVEAGGGAFLEARRAIFDRYRDLRSDAMTGRVLDLLSRRLWELTVRNYEISGELDYQRARHRALADEVALLGRSLEESQLRAMGLEGEVATLTGERNLLAETAARTNELHAEIRRLDELRLRMESTKAWKFHLWFQRLKGVE